MEITNRRVQPISVGSRKRCQLFCHKYRKNKCNYRKYNKEETEVKEMTGFSVTKKARYLGIIIMNKNSDLIRNNYENSGKR